MTTRWIGPLTFLIALAGLTLGLWWLAAPAGFAAALVAREGGRPFLDGFLGGLLAWAVVDVWRILLWHGYDIAWLTSALAGLPAPAASVFFALPGLLAALAAGFGALAGAHLRSARQRRTPARTVTAVANAPKGVPGE